ALLANLLFVFGLASGAESLWSGGSWALGSGVAASPWLSGLLAANAAMLLWRQGARAWWSGRVYGPRFAALAPVRAVWGSWINAAAVARATMIFLHAKWRRRPLRWSKTQHAYPNAAVDPARLKAKAAR